MKIFSQVYPKAGYHSGGNWTDRHLTFSLHAADAIKIEFFFYKSPHLLKLDEKCTLLAHVILQPEDYRQGDLWTWEGELSNNISLESLGYLIRVWKNDPLEKPRYRWILDPYARECSGGETWGEPTGFKIDLKTFALRRIARPEKESNYIRRIPIIRPSRPLIPRPPRPKHAMKDVVIYECHVRGMTQSPTFQLSSPEHRGTYRGLIDCIPHFQKLGVTSVELLPIYEFDETENKNTSPVSQEPLLNYWGYSPILFFAPKQSYACDSTNPIREFKKMVDAFHAANLEIILDVVYNHTAEQDSKGPIIHFKWLAPQEWYIHDEEQKLSNYSGCGNTLNCSHPVVKEMIINSLRYWVTEMGVDGFRFDITTILTRDHQGQIEEFPQLLWEIKNDPVLRDVKLIAEPWDAAGGYQLGHFYHHLQYSEWNDRYRDTIRRALIGEEGLMGAVKESILGSPEVYPADIDHIGSINFITAHDGMTLWDLNAYDMKQNDVNGEQNRDGCNANYSNNCGEEGPSSKKEIADLRKKKIKTAMLLLQLSQGIPMLLAGDEMGRTQKGNNNGYCIDSPLTWMDWDLLKLNQDLFEFLTNAIEFRKNLSSFLFSEKSHYRWLNTKEEPADFQHHVRTLMWEISHPDFPEKCIRVLLNCYDKPLEFHLSKRKNWHLIFDTATHEKSQADVSSHSSVVLVEGFSIQVYSSSTDLTK